MVAGGNFKIMPVIEELVPCFGRVWISCMLNLVWSILEPLEIFMLCLLSTDMKWPLTGRQAARVSIALHSVPIYIPTDETKHKSQLNI